MEEHTRSIMDYINVLRKHKTPALVIMILIIVLSAAISVLLPPTFKSSATILIEQQAIPTELVQTTVTSYATERLKTIEARVMSRTNLLKVIEKFKLYPEKIKLETTEEIIARMRKNSAMRLINASGAKGTQGAIAFTLSFSSDRAKTAQKVANELTSLYLNENLKSRTQEAEDTSNFLSDEVERMGKNISELELKLATFKFKNAELLPELQQSNNQNLQRTESAVISSNSRIQSLNERIFYLETQLSQIQPDNSGIGSRLKILEAEISSLRSRYSDKHPDVAKAMREIKILKDNLNGKNKTKGDTKEIIELKAELALLNEKYSPKHPDVIRIKSKIYLKTKLLTNKSSTNVNVDPAYAALRTQLNSANSELRTVKIKRTQSLKKLAEIERILRESPEVEREYLLLRRDYTNAVTQYNSTKSKLMLAESAKQLESESKGERFTLIDPPALPQRPISPNRPAILFLGFVLAIAGGIGFAFGLDFLSGAIHGEHNIKSLLGVAPLAIIPRQLSAIEAYRRTLARKRFMIIAAVGVLICIILIHLLVSPLDVLWFRIMRKVDVFMG